MFRTKPTAKLSLAAIAVCVALASCGGNDDNNNNTPAPVARTVVPTGIRNITINTTTDAVAPSQNPTFAGTTFGAVGAYRKIIGTATGLLDPADPHNTLINDIALAPRDANGMVSYSMDFYILMPVDPTKGNHKVFVEEVNRGNKQFALFNGSGGGNNPTTAADAGTGFLMNQGYTMVWVGWEPNAVSRVGPGTNFSMGLTAPVAKNADGSSITGLDYEYLETDNSTTTSFTTAYNTNSTDTTKATLTVKQHLTDTPTTIPSTGWTWTSANTIALLPAGTRFTQSAIYELTFTAKDPVVGGVGFAGVRDFISFLRTATADAAGTANPLAGTAPTRFVSWTLSQPSRFMNDFIWLGFNQDLNGKQVFDGVFNWVGAGDGIGLNYRFEQSGRTERNRQNKLYPEAPFPFSYTTTTDPFSGVIDGRNVRCTATNTCPKVMNINSSNEYWVKAGSLLHTDGLGNDVVEPANVRNYLVASTQHASPSGINSLGICAQYQNPIDQNPALRALFFAMDQWIDNTAPPPSMVPRRADANAVLTQTTAQSLLGIGVVPQASLGWPTIPNALYTGLVTIRDLLNFGPNFAAGILSINPPTPSTKVYQSFVSKVDAQDGNELAGIRLPPVSVPLATAAGWGLRGAAFSGPDGCESSGTYIPFAIDQAHRTAIGDTRPSLTERYTTHANYVTQVTTAANALAAQRLLLPADVQKYITTAANPVVVGADNPVYPGGYTW
jgi:hypothetical protein